MTSEGTLVAFEFMLSASSPKATCIEVTIRKEILMNLSTTGLRLAADSAIDLHLHTTYSDGTWTPE